MTNLTDMLSKFVNANTASSSGTGSLPSNTITNLKEDLKGITTRSGVAYQGPTIPTFSSSPKVVEHETEPVVISVSASMPNLKPTIPYPSRCNDERRHEKANDQIEKFYKIFKDLSFEISLTDDLILMPKFASTLKALIENKEKLSEMARTLLNEHCSAVILNKLPKKLGDPGKFLIPCDFLGMDECLALADLGTCINLMPLSVWKRLSLPKLTPTCTTLELVDRTISQPIDPRVPLILGRSFLKIRRALIDVYKGELTLRVGKEAVTFNLDQTSRYSANYDDMTANRIDVIEMDCEEYSQEVLDDPTLPEVDGSYYDSEGDILLLEAILNSDPSPPPPNQGNYLLEIRKEHKIYEAKSDKSSIDEPPEVELKDLPPYLEYAFLRILMEDDYKPEVQHQRRVNPKIHDVIKKEVEKLLDAGLIYPISDSPWVSPVHCVPRKGGFTVVANDKNELIPTRLVTGWRVCIDYRKLNEAIHHEKTTFICPYGTFAYHRMSFGLCNAQGTFQRCMLAIFHDMVKKTIEVFMDDFLVFGNSFENCLSRLDKMLQRCKDTNLCLNWEKSHFMVKDGIVLGHKISKNEIEVDKAKVDVIAKLPHPTTVKGVRSFLGHAGFYRRFIQDFSKIARPMTYLLKKETLFFFSKVCIESFNTLKRKLTEAPILISPNWDLPFELMCDASNFAIGAVLGQRKNKHFQPIHYASKTMTEAQAHYTTREKELLAVVYAFKKFRSYLILSKSIVYTDHSAIKYLFAKKDAKPRLMR
ncbi:reverse transcriptase domain-containing protein [Tanacetum coccineum]